MNESAAGNDSPIESDEPLKLIETINSSTKVVWYLREIIRVEEFADAIQLDP
jgi:hypothetical protein